MKNIVRLLIVMTLLVSCGSDKKSDATKESGVHKVIAQEVLHVNEYSYIRVLENEQNIWIAAPSTPIEIGNTYYYGKTMEMQNFESKDLNKIFETVYFVERISTTADEATKPLTANPHPENQNTFPEATKPVIEKKETNIEAVKDGITIAELMENKEKYAGKIVKLKGKVTKYNPAIMNANWFHMQDGSDFNGEFDLTVTTSAEVKLDQIVTIKGMVTLNKDFGAGYFYAIIIEQAEIIK